MKMKESKITTGQFDISIIMSLLSNDIMYQKSELHGLGINDNDELSRDSIKESSFEMGFLYARKLILDYLNES